MVRKYLFYLEIAVLTELQLAIIASAIFALSAAFAQSSRANSIEDDRRFEDFFDQLQVSDQSTQLPQHLQPYAGTVITRYYLIKTTNPDPILERANEAFRAECAAWSGHIEKIENVSQMVKDYYASRDERTPDPFFGYRPMVCLDSIGHPLGALRTDSTIPLSNGDSWATIVLFSRKATTDMLLAHYNANDRRANEEKQKAQALINWRLNLKIGDATQCGDIIEVRGPMVQITSGTRTAWARRETLYPDGTASCFL